MSFRDTKQFKKGEIGEQIVDEYLQKKGVIPYRPIADKAHPFDRLCATSDKKRIFVVEVKTKPKREAYPDTGIDFRHYNDYVRISFNYSMDVFIYFVDEVQKSIYGGELFSVLAQDRWVTFKDQSGKAKTQKYPWDHKGIIYFPMEAMEHIAELPDDVCKQLAELRQSTYDPRQGSLV